MRIKNVIFYIEPSYIHFYIEVFTSLVWYLLYALMNFLPNKNFHTSLAMKVNICIFSVGFPRLWNTCQSVIPTLYHFQDKNLLENTSSEIFIIDSSNFAIEKIIDLLKLTVFNAIQGRTFTQNITRLTNLYSESN